MKDVKYLNLFDIYSPVLTEKQKEIFEAYYSFDLSLSEIAEEKGVTRQSVADSLKKTRRELDGLEEKLKFAKLKKSLVEFSEGLENDQREELIKILSSEI